MNARMPSFGCLLVCAMMLLSVAGCRLERRAIAAPLLEPADTLTIPEGPLGVAIRRGRAIATATRDSLPAHVGNQLRCTSCHLDEARRPNAAPWTGILTRFPQYRSRAGRVITLEDRINGCFERSLHGTALPPGDPAMRDLMAYMAWLSTGTRVGDSIPGSGFLKLPLRAADTAAGATVYAAECARCHGVEGEGAMAPPLWGPASYNVGAGMARLSIAASFIYANMPNDRAGGLTEQQAFDVAAYINAQPRPDFAPKAEDWPNGDAPPDAAYPTRAASRPRP